jgi:hypothetical protein
LPDGRIQEHVPALAADLLVASQQALALVSGVLGGPEPTFHGSMYSSILCWAGMVHPKEVSAVSAADARSRPRALGVTL